MKHAAVHVSDLNRRRPARPRPERAYGLQLCADRRDARDDVSLDEVERLVI
jgi:hypothetical protein